jgi:hypothetical protein
MKLLFFPLWPVSWDIFQNPLTDHRVNMLLPICSTLFYKLLLVEFVVLSQFLRIFCDPKGLITQIIL